MRRGAMSLSSPAHPLWCRSFSLAVGRAWREPLRAGPRTAPAAQQVAVQPLGRLAQLDLTHPPAQAG